MLVNTYRKGNGEILVVAVLRLVPQNYAVLAQIC